MLQEILLSLSGHRSPLWEQIKEDVGNEEPDSIRNHLSPSEMALLVPLAHLSDLHIKLRDHTSQVSTSHPSGICRTVASSIASDSLGKFRQKILEVEKSILINDAAYVGAYGIVPLSTVVGEFSPWTRRLEWLWQVATYMSPAVSGDSQRKAQCTGAEIIDHLEIERYTGYSDLEEMAATLLETAQRTWMRQIATWILYGKLPSYDSEDFCIGETTSKSAVGGKTYTLRQRLIPKCVSKSAAASLLSIGESLNQIRSQSTTSVRAATDPVMALLPVSLAHLNKLNYPLSSAAFASTIASIRLSISQNALSQLLPLPKVLEVLHVIQEFQLLGRGEFAIALINHADARIAKRPQEVAKPVRKAGRLDDMTIKEAETSAILSHTFADLSSLQRYDVDEDDVLEKARLFLRLVVKGTGDVTDTSIFISTLLPAPTSLELALPKDSALNLFLTPQDLERYASISSYLISIRRAELHLSSLWKVTSLRRCQPTPLGPPASARPGGQKLLATQRTREAKRSAQLRKHWASASKAMFVLNELGAYFQEVVRGNWEHFRSWIDQAESGRPGSAASTKSGSRPGTASSAGAKQLKTSQISNSTNSGEAQGRMTARNDPVALSQAHRLYLRNLFDSVLLGHKDFVQALRNILNTVDHFTALFRRLQSAWQGLDLQEDEGVIDALSNFVKEEREVLDEMVRSGKLLEEALNQLVEQVGKTEQDRNKEDITELEEGLEGLGLDAIYTPPRARTIDRLIMKLDMLQGTRVGSDDEKGYDDD
jgi:hypothetical protein